MNKCHFLFFLIITLLIFMTDANAKTVYVTDNLDLPLRSQESNKAKIISLLPTGTPLTLLKENPKSGFSLVKLQNGMEGYIATRNTMPEPPNRSPLEANSKNMGALQAENFALKEELAKVKAVITPDTPLEESLAADRDRLDRELIELKKTATSQIQLKNERDKFQEELVNVKRELEQVKLENNALKDGANQDWFLYGGMLALAGVFLGFILPKLSWRRNSGWDRL